MAKAIAVAVNLGSHAYAADAPAPMHLRQHCLGYCSDMRTEVAGNIGHPILYRRHAKLTRVQLRRHAGGKALRWLLLPAAHVLIRPGTSPDGTGGYVADTWAAYENQALERMYENR